MVKMDVLRRACERAGFRDVRTYVQSGNIVFFVREYDAIVLAARLESLIEATFGFRPAVIVRSKAELIEVVARNPFIGDPAAAPDRLLISFLGSRPSTEAWEYVRSLKVSPEVIHTQERELYIHFPDGMGRSKLSMAAVERKLKVPMTGRNLNTVVQLLAIADEIELSSEIVPVSN